MSNLSLDDLENHVVAAALADTDLLEVATTKVGARLRGKPASLLRAASAYFNLTRGALDRPALAQILANSEPDLDKHQDYLALFDALTAPPYTELNEAQRRWLVHQFDIEWRRNATGNILAEAAEKMRIGHTAHGRDLIGSDAAWQFLAEARVTFESNTGADAHTEGELTEQTDLAKQDYHLAKESKYIGAPLSLPECNDLTGGLRNGDLHFEAGYANEGKSFIMLNDGHNSWLVGRNVAIATGEMSVAKYRSRFVALHSSYLADKGKVPFPIETKKIDRGLLSDEEHEVFLAVLEDMKSNPAYGKLFVYKFPWKTTPSTIFNKFAQWDQVVPLGLGVIDYLGLCSSDQQRVSRREELDDLIRQTKQLAMTFRGDEGIPVIAGYQVNRQSFERARQDGYYTLACFSESSEAEKSCDTAVWILSQPQNPNELKIGFNKNRDDELGDHFFIQRDFKYARIRSLRSGAQANNPTRNMSSLLDIT
jgi:hypothetical protein